MGNTECQKCIDSEKEMFAEIILGREFANKKYIYNSKRKLKKISEENPHENINNNNKELLIKQNQHQLNQKAQQIINRNNDINSNIKNTAIENEIYNKNILKESKENKNEKEEKQYVEVNEENEQEYEYEQGNEDEEPLDADVEHPHYQKKDEYEEDNQNQEHNYLENEDEEYELDDYKNKMPNGLSEDENNYQE